MRVLVTGVLIFLNMVLQSSLFQYIEVLNVKPNTAIIIVVSFAVLRGDIEGAIVGFCCGILQDIFFGRIIGLHALLCMLTGFLCGKPFKDFYRDTYIMPLILVVASVFAYEFLFYFTSFLFRGRLDLSYYMRTIIIPKAVYTTLLCIPVFRLIYWINSRLEAREAKARKLF